MRLLTMLRSSRALDCGKPHRVEKQQALVHAALRDAAGVQAERDDTETRSMRLRAIMERVHQAGAPTPLPWWQARRGVLLSALALFVGGAGVLVHARVSAQPQWLDSLPVVRALWSERAESTLASGELRMTDDAVLACAEAPVLREGEPWMSVRPELAAKREAQLAVAELRRRTNDAESGTALALTPELAKEASVLRAQLDEATQTMLSRLPGQGEPK